METYRSSVLCSDLAVQIKALDAGAQACLPPTVDPRLLSAQIRALVVGATHRTQGKATEESQSHLAAIIESSDDAILSKDLRGIIQTWNPGAQRLLGYAAEEMLGKPVTVLVPADRLDEEERILARLWAGQRVEHLETVRVTKDGRRIDVSLTISPLKDAGGRVVGASKIMRDITERKRAEQALREADRRKDEFIAILSHELRNPLAPIRYALPLLQRERLSESGARAVGVIDRQARALTMLMDALLDVSRISRGTIELRREHFTLEAILKAAVEAASPAIAAARHTLKVVVPAEPIRLHGDPTRLAQVFTNLLNNSAKFMPSPGEIALEAQRQDGQAIICVRDAGIGLSEHTLSTVFEMFRQVNAPEAAQGGLGIGLALAKRLVEMHGGSIEARSAGVGQGAEFIVRVPVAVDARVPTIAQAPTQAGVSGRRLKVLIVDDNSDLVEMLSAVVVSLGHDVRTASDGPDAVSAALAFRPDVVLLDLGLPIMSGIDVARELRRQPDTASAHLVALTGWGQAEDRRQTQEVGFEHHLTKPTDPATLERLLAQFARP